MHIICKDILRFHTIYSPIFLLALDLPLPNQIIVPPWLLVNDGQISKPKGNGIYAYLDAGVFGVAAVRYSLFTETLCDNASP